MKIWLNVVWISFAVLCALLMSEGARSLGGIWAQFFALIFCSVLGTIVGEHIGFRLYVLEKKWAKKNYP